MGTKKYTLAIGSPHPLRRESDRAGAISLRQNIQEWLDKNRGKECTYTGRICPLYARVEGIAPDGKVVIRYNKDGKSKTLNVSRNLLVFFEPGPKPEEKTKE